MSDIQGAGGGASAIPLDVRDAVSVDGAIRAANRAFSASFGWSREEIDHVIKSGERKDAKLTKPVPLYWVYVTAWATPDGVTQFREDIYNRDGLHRLRRKNLVAVGGRMRPHGPHLAH